MMNKKGNLMLLAPILTVFSLISIIFITNYYLSYAIIYDYPLFEMQQITESLEADGIVIEGLSNITLGYAQSFRDMPLYVDELWLMVYVILIASSVTWAYTTRKTNYFGFLSFLFYGTMVILSILGFFVTITDWWRVNILDPLLPSLIVDVPIFYWFLENIGLNILVLVGVCAFVNFVDFDFAMLFGRKKKEKIALTEDEI